MTMLRRRNEVSGPVIGVSAVIDGREAAMKKQQARVGKVARMVAELVDTEFPHIDGKPAHVVLADRLVKDAASARRVGRQFHRDGVEVLLCYDDVWAYPGELEGLLLQNISLGQIPVAHVSGNSATWPGVVYACAATGMLAQWGYLAHRIVGDLVEKDGLPAGFSPALKVRRALGDYSFLYVCLHFAIFVSLDYGFDFQFIFPELIRPYALVGLIAGLLLIPLAITSFSPWPKRLGKNWKRLHNLVYLIDFLAAFHFILVVKQGVTEPYLWMILIIFLLFLRLPPIRHFLSGFFTHQE